MRPDRVATLLRRGFRCYDKNVASQFVAESSRLVATQADQTSSGIRAHPTHLDTLLEWTYHSSRMSTKEEAERKQRGDHQNDEWKHELTLLSM